MRIWFKVAFIAALVFAGASTAGAGVSFQMGTDNFFLSVGDYDYLPYAYENDPGYVAPQINFTDMMRQYGRWVRVAPFGQVWRPYASAGWRPYTYGHWLYTEYGPYWEGYEPWAWAGYHYGSWIFSRRYGWVWVPGYEWHPGRVAWARGYETIGWMPMPPDGYDYRQGNLAFVGRNSQFNYSDNNFGEDYGSDPYGNGGAYNDPRARDMYYNPSYSSININLWVFIDGANFEQDNYADYELGPDYTRYAFDQRMVKISNRPMELGVLENITRQQIQQIPVDVREMRTDKRTIRVVVPSGNVSAERIRQQSPQVVRQVIAPAFAQEQKQFKGNASKIQAPIAKIFRQENVQPRVETRTRQQVIDAAREAQNNKVQKQNQSMEKVKVRTEQFKREGKIVEPRKNANPPPLNPADNRPAPGHVTQQQNIPVQQVNSDNNPAPRPLPMNPVDNRPAGSRVMEQQNTPVPPVAPDRSPAPRPAPQNAASMASPSEQPAPPTPAVISEQPRPVNPAPPPRRNPMNMAPPSAQPEPPTPTNAPQQPRPMNPAASPRPINPSDNPVAPSRETQGVITTDAGITSQALKMVKSSLPAVARGVSIRTKAGIVTVSGKVGSPDEAAKIIKLVSSISGVKSVKSQLSVKRPQTR